MAISDFLPTRALANTLHIRGVSVTQRLLCQLEEQESVDIDFKVKMKRECQTSECADADQIFNDIYKNVVGGFSDAVPSGFPTTAIQKEASDQGVTTLQKSSALSKLGSQKSRLQKEMVMMMAGVENPVLALT
eukprot:7696239-Ditylum_brightwellii.AAC.1